jgi:hypothetical protein
VSDVITIGLPAGVAVALVVNVILTLSNRARTRQLANGDGNVMMKILKDLADGQKDCRECLMELKSSETRQTEILSDMRDILQRIASNRQ